MAITYIYHKPIYISAYTYQVFISFKVKALLQTKNNKGKLSNKQYSNSQLYEVVFISSFYR